MIPWRSWIWTPPLDSDLDTSHKFPKLLTCDYCVSPRSKSFFFFFWGTFIWLGGLLGLDLGLGLGPGLDNNDWTILIDKSAWYFVFSFVQWVLLFWRTKCGPMFLLKMILLHPTLFWQFPICVQFHSVWFSYRTQLWRKSTSSIIHST